MRKRHTLDESGSALGSVLTILFHQNEKHRVFFFFLIVVMDQVVLLLCQMIFLRYTPYLYCIGTLYVPSGHAVHVPCIYRAI